MRPIDLAREAGLSTQQVRNYVDTGVLPPAPRTAAGYRTLDIRHSRALATYRALVGGYGWNTAGDVMRAIHGDDIPRALSLVDASHAALHEERESLRAVGEALEAVASEAPEPPRKSMRVGEVARYLGVRPSALRVWEEAGLLQPERDRGTKYRRYGPDDVRDARMVHMLRQGRYPLNEIRPILDGLRRTGSSDALREAIAQRQEFIATRTRAMLEAAGHLHAYLSG
ncbi:MerR family transcriptional regulator [Kibdelosporangium lantanae]